MICFWNSRPASAKARLRSPPQKCLVPGHHHCQHWAGDQYMEDFASMGLKQLHAKDHYFCPDFLNCRSGYDYCERSKENAILEQKLIAGDETYTPECLLCPYREARFEFFKHSTSGISNMAYLLRCARISAKFSATSGGSI